MNAGIIVLLVIAALIVLTISRAIRIIPQARAAVVERLGSYSRTLGPGLHFLVPFIDRKALGGVAGIIGAGGNVGAVAAGFLLKASGNLPQTLYVLGWTVLCSALCAAAVRFSTTHKRAEQILYDQALAQRMGLGTSSDYGGVVSRAAQ